MMPGETHSKAAGTAADASGCQGCSALQQNLNEYVAALLTLKQKIIDTDNLLTEYQKKCDELQFAERENSALRKQVEQMLQKISPLEKCQEELGCLKAELEEKKSSLKIYQDSYHEYTRVKEECLKSDARKKKLEAKVKKLEEAAVKHTEDLKQLKIEKKTLEKELKKTQEKLDEIPKQNNKKVLKHMGTQSCSNESVETLDKRKIKLLLKELWLCIDSTKERLQNEGSEDVQDSIDECSEITEKKSVDCKKEKTAKENLKSRKSVEECGLLPRMQSNHLSPPEMKTCLTSFSVHLEQELLLGGCRSTEEDGPIAVNVQDCSNDSAFHEDRNPEVFMPSSWEDDSSDSSDQEDPEDKPLLKDLEAIFDLFRLPPPLLSPVSTPPPTPLRCQMPPSSPLAPEDYFGDFTDSSEDELVDNEHTMQPLLENGTTESLNAFPSPRGQEESSKLIEQPEPNLRTQDPMNLEMNEEMSIRSDILTTELKFKDSKPHSKEMEIPFSGASPISYKEDLLVLCENTEDENKCILDKSIIPQDEEERDDTPMQSKGVSFEIHCLPTETECLQKISDNQVQVTDNAILNDEICNSLLSQENLVLPVAPEGKNSLSGAESQKSECMKQVPIGELTSENEKMFIVSEHFQEIAGELSGKEAKEIQGLNIQKPSESKQDVPIMVDTSELDIKTNLVSSSPTIISSNCSNPQFPFDLGYNNEVSWKFSGQCTLIEAKSKDFLHETVSNQLHCTEQKSYETIQNKILDTLNKQSEPTDYSKGEYNLEKNINALPNSATPKLSDQVNRETECSDVSKVMTSIYVVDQAAFVKNTDNEQLETEESGIELNTSKSEDVISALSQSDLVKRSLDLDISASGHNADTGMLIKKEYDRSSEVKLKCEQDNKQLQTEMPIKENTLSSPKLDCHREEINPVEFKVVSILDHQVSTIPEQLKSEEPQVTKLEDLESHIKERTLAPENTETEPYMPSKAKGIDEKKFQSLKIKQIETINCTSAQDSTSWMTSDLKSFSESLSVETSHYDTIRKLPARSGEISLQNQENNVSEVDKKQDQQNQGPFKILNVKEEFTLSTKVSLADGLATDVVCSRNASVSDAESLDTPLDSVSLNVQQVQKERTPGNTCLDSYMKEGCAFSSSLSKKDENETHVSLNILKDIVQCYMGSQEETKHDSDAQKYIQISYDCKSKSEAETKNKTKEQNFNEGLQTQVEKTNTNKDAHAHMKRRGSLEMEYLTSALKDFNISVVNDTNGFSASEIFKLLENSQLWDFASENSMLEYFDKVVTNKEVKKELRPGKISEENLRRNSWMKTHEVNKDKNDSEEDDFPLRKVRYASQFTHCSLEEATKTNTKDIPGIQNDCKDSDAKYADFSSFLNTCSGVVVEHLKEDCGITKCSSDIKQSSLILDFDSERKTCTNRFLNENTQRREYKEYSDTANRRNDSKDTLEIRAETVGKNIIEQNTSNSEGPTLLHHIAQMNSEITNGYGKDSNLNLSIKESDDWKITKDENLKSSMDEIIVHEHSEAVPRMQAILSEDVLEDALDPVASTEYTPNTEQEQSDFLSKECCFNCPSRQKDGLNSDQNGIFDKDPLWNSSMSDVSFDSQGNNQTAESPNISFESTHDTLELEPFVDFVDQTKSRPKTSNLKPSHNLTKTLVKSKVEIGQGKTSRKSSRVKKSKAKPQQSHVAQPVLATADTSTPTKCSPDTLSKIRQEMGPPLPPLLAPLLATPPRTLNPVSPLMSTSSQSSLTSPLDDLISPLRDTPVPPLMSPLSDDPRYKSPMHSTPSPSDAPTSQRILSSPLQFCAATPKHALPVPGRLPPLAVGNTTLGGPQENSVKILDTMYPELSARARTLNILKGNIQLNRCPPADCKNLPGPVNNITGFKAITSTSTAFVKTGSSSNTECDQGKPKDSGTELMSFQSHSGKRPLVPSAILRSAKRLRLDSESPKLEIKVDVPETIKTPQNSSQAENEIINDDDENFSVQEPADISITESSSALLQHKEPHDEALSSVLKKIAESSFDLLPVIRSHVHVGNVSKKPVMRDQEKEVVYEFSTTKQHLAKPLLHAILSELKIHKTSLDHTYIHALCRVYVGICRQLGDLERARLFCYDLLKEDFPESDKLTLFIANIWHDIFAFQGVINKAMQLVVRQRAKGEVLNCLITYLNWEKTSSLDVSMMISKLLLTIQLCPKMEFHISEKFGEDLNDDTWEYIFAIDLLCCHQKWVWTHDNIISKELWPIMDKWIKHRKGHLNIAYTPDIIVALILRLIGRLGQLGLKEGFSSAVKNISSVICMFIQHSNEEDVPWSIQLAAVYALCDLSPSNPAEVSKVIENWTRMTTKNIPSAVMSYLAEVNLLCAAELD